MTSANKPRISSNAPTSVKPFMCCPRSLNEFDFYSDAETGRSNESVLSKTEPAVIPFDAGSMLSGCDKVKCEPKWSRAILARGPSRFFHHVQYCSDFLVLSRAC